VQIYTGAPLITLDVVALLAICVAGKTNYRFQCLSSSHVWTTPMSVLHSTQFGVHPTTLQHAGKVSRTYKKVCDCVPVTEQEMFHASLELDLDEDTILHASVIVLLLKEGCNANAIANICALTAAAVAAAFALLIAPWGGLAAGVAGAGAGTLVYSPRVISYNEKLVAKNNVKLAAKFVSPLIKNKHGKTPLDLAVHLPLMIKRGIFKIVNPSIQALIKRMSRQDVEIAFRRELLNKVDENVLRKVLDLARTPK
jgi:hypothetical protein